MLYIECFVCNSVLDSPGAVLLSAPETSYNSVEVVEKYHLCQKCWLSLKVGFLTNKGDE